jgi:hypothetical protein
VPKSISLVDGTMPSGADFTPAAAVRFHKQLSTEPAPGPFGPWARGGHASESERAHRFYCKRRKVRGISVRVSDRRSIRLIGLVDADSDHNEIPREIFSDAWIAPPSNRRERNSTQSILCVWPTCGFDADEETALPGRYRRLAVRYCFHRLQGCGNACGGGRSRIHYLALDLSIGVPYS